ncbi:MAG: hypothetical protein NC313_12760 [Butyrivibrio sp.]|nr:hypothetical protein [Butyrivibrio sp.]
MTFLFVKYVADRFKSIDNWDIEISEGDSFDNIDDDKLAEANNLNGIFDIADFNSEELSTDKEAIKLIKGKQNIIQIID